MGPKARPGTCSRVRPSSCDVLFVVNIELFISRWKVTVLMFVPSMILQLVNTLGWERTDFSTVDTLGSGAAFLPPELQAKVKSKMKANFVQGYGSTESVRAPLTSAIPERFTSW